MFTSELFKAEFAAGSLDAQQPRQPLADEDTHLLTSYILPALTIAAAAAAARLPVIARKTQKSA